MPTISPKPYKQMQAEYAALCRALAAQTDAAYRRDITTPLYLIGQRRPGLDTLNPTAPIWSALDIAPDHEDRLDWYTVTSQPLPRSQTIDHLAHTIRSILNSEPLYIFAD